MAGIGFFAPLPLALMMPFMAGQSMLMGDAFGKAYQYGKRKISAMSNEEFNKLTPQQLGQSIATDYTAIIPSLQDAIKQSSAFQSMIIQELAKIIRSVPSDIISGITGNQELGNTLQTNLQSNIQGGAELISGLTNFLNSIGDALPSAYGASPPTTTPPTADQYAHTLGTHAGHTVGNITVTQGPTEGPPAPPDYTPPPPPPTTTIKPPVPVEVMIRTTSYYPNKTGTPTTGQVVKYLTTLMRKNSPAFRIIQTFLHAKGGKPGFASITHDFKVKFSKLTAPNTTFFFVIPNGY